MKKNEQPIRIAQVMGYMNGAGVESVVTNYYKFINKSKFQFDFICCKGSTNIPYEEIESQGGRVFLISPYKKIFSYYAELKKILKNGNYKIVHSHVNSLSVFPLFVAKRVGIPIRIAHSHSSSSRAEKYRNIVKNFLKIFSKTFATNYFCCSEYAGRWLFGNKAYEEGNVFLLNNAIEIEKFAYNDRIRKNKRQELNLKDSTLVIGHIGRFMKQKNHDFLIDIFKEIQLMNPNSMLILAGQGLLEDEIKNKVNKLNLNKCVKFLGQVEDANALYQVFDIFVLPSLYEGLPVVGVEAQASGLLCILSDNMTKETKILDSTKFLSLERSSQEWAQEIVNSIKEFRRHDTEKEIIESRFNIKKEVIKLEEKYCELLDMADMKIRK